MQRWYLAAINKIQAYLKPRSQEEEVQCHDVIIFYNFVFDIGKPVNPTQAARDLLKKDFACASANHITDNVEIAPRFKQLLKLRERVVQVDIIWSHVRQHNWKAALSWVLHHPKHTLFILQNSKRRKSGKYTQTSMLQQKTTAIDLKDTLKFIDASMAKFQSLEKLQLYSDKQLFSPLYLREAPFVRITLQPFFATINGENIGIDVSLVIHRIGVAILTCGVMFQGPKTIDALIQLKVLGEIEISHFEVAKVLVEIPSTAHELEQMKITPANKRHSSGIEWCEYKVQRPVNLYFIFHLYQNAIIASINKKTLKRLGETFSWLRTTDWFAYPIMFIRQVKPNYPTDEGLKKHHAQELAGLVLGFSQWKQVKPEKIQEVITRDFALTSSYSFYLEASHATVIYHNDHLAQLQKQFGKNIPGHEWLFQHFQASGIIEALLIQQWLLHIFDCELNVLSYNLTKLNRLKQNLIIALDEYHKILFSHGTAQDIFKGGQEIMHIHDRYEGIIHKLDRVEKLIEVKESQQLAKRNLFFNFVLLLLTLMAGLPSAQQIVTIISSWHIFTFNSIITEQVLYVLIVLLVVISIIWQLLPTYNKKPIVSFDQSHIATKKHFTWPRRVRFTSVRSNGSSQNTN